MSNSFESVCVWHVHIKCQMLARGGDLIMIIGSKLQNKCERVQKETLPCFLCKRNDSPAHSQAQCDIHANQTALMPCPHSTLTPFV